MNRIILFFCFSSFIQGVFAQSDSLFEARIYTSEGDSLPYRILYPEFYEPHESYPLVLFLHGGGERGKDNNKQLLHGVSIFSQEHNRREFPCIVVVPQCPSEDYWASADIDRTNYPLNIQFDYNKPMTNSLKMALRLLKSLINHEKVDRKRIYIAGLSMGGMGSFEAIYREPGLFSGAAIICGGGDTSAYNIQQPKTAFWIFHGSEDVVVRAEYSKEMYLRLLELKADVRFTEYIGVNHNSWDNAFAEPDLLPWLFNQKAKIK